VSDDRPALLAIQHVPWEGPKNLDALPKPMQQPRLPLILGGPRSLRLAVALADEYNTAMSRRRRSPTSASASMRPAKRPTATPRACRSR
jgi:alkanesulfonate monooxygenase SsuD/methylene tetrahydromethanopterin reductase-like flavin-dependent oxidoreductase (luciferase family)